MDRSSHRNGLLSLYGTCNGLWDADGGSEAWLRRERENWYGEKGEPQWSRIPSAQELQGLVDQLKRYNPQAREVRKQSPDK